MDWSSNSSRRRTVPRERELFVHLRSPFNPFYTSVFGSCNLYLTILKESYTSSVSSPPQIVFDPPPDLDELSIPHGLHSLSITDVPEARAVSSHSYIAARKRFLTSSFPPSPHRSNEDLEDENAYLNSIFSWSPRQSRRPGRTHWSQRRPMYKDPQTHETNDEHVMPSVL